MSRSRSSKKKSNLKHIYILIFVLAVLAGGYYYIEKLENETPQNYVPAPLTKEEGSTLRYAVLENTDSTRYEAIIIYSQDVSISDVSRTFYNNDKFWPYIYLENKALISNPLDIKKDVILKIPRLSSVFRNSDESKTLERAKFLADSILSNSKPAVNDGVY